MTVCIELQTSKCNKLTIGTVYRPPKQQAAADAALCEDIQAMTQTKQSVIIGDFNCPKSNWSTMTGDQEGNRLLEKLKDTFMTQIISQPTRENNIHYLVFVTDPDLVSEGKVGEILSVCDHHLIRFSIRKEHDLLENVSKIPDYRKANFSLARELLPQSTWKGLNLALVDDAWNSFKNRVLEVERATVPMKTRRTSNDVNSPWFTTQVRRAINLKKRHYKAMKENNTTETPAQYHSSLRACGTLVRQCKRDYEKQIAREAKTNPKKFYHLHKNKKRNRKTTSVT